MCALREQSCGSVYHYTVQSKIPRNVGRKEIRALRLLASEHSLRPSQDRRLVWLRPLLRQATPGADKSKIPDEDLKGKPEPEQAQNQN